MVFLGTLKIFVGFPCSGKTTKSLELSGAHLHIDAIRKSLTGTHKPNNDEQFVKNILLQSVEYYLKQGRTVIVDGCFLSKNERKSLLSIAKRFKSGTEVHWMDTPFSILVERMKERNKQEDDDRKMDLHYLHKCTDYFEIPTYDEAIDRIVRHSNSNFL